ncbi:MAG: phosphoribosylformylglycinamidine synthase subunit PurS [Candidatus Nitrosomaritimum yanchengensis]
MKEYKVKVEVKLKSVVLDPQGKAVLSSLHNLGFSEVEDCRVGKLIELNIKDSDSENIKDRVDDMCKKLLSNPVIEDYKISMEEILKDG